MEMKYYNASNNFKAPIPREPKPYKPPQQLNGEVIVPQPPKENRERKLSIPEEFHCDEGNKPSFNLIKNQDDLLLVGLILLLLVNQCNDYLLLLVLGYLLFCDKQ